MIRIRSTLTQTKSNKTRHNCKKYIHCRLCNAFKKHPPFGSMPDSMIGAIFDWDGVIIDSSSHHEKSWEGLAAETGFFLPPDHFKRGFGMMNTFIIPKLLKWAEAPDEVHRLSLRKEALYRELVVEHGIAALPGVTKWLDELRRFG